MGFCVLVAREGLTFGYRGVPVECVRGVCNDFSCSCYVGLTAEPLLRAEGLRRMIWNYRVDSCYGDYLSARRRAEELAEMLEERLRKQLTLRTMLIP